MLEVGNKLVCKKVVVQVKYLDDAQLNLSGMLAGDFVIKVVQPDGSFIFQFRHIPHHLSFRMKFIENLMIHK